MSDLPKPNPDAVEDVPYASQLDSLLMQGSESISDNPANPLSMQKGESLSLPQLTAALDRLQIGLGWDVSEANPPFDLDASVFLLTQQGKVRGEQDFIFYNQTTSICGGVIHSGDSRTGSGDGDDEVITVDLTKLPPEIVRLVFTVTIHDAIERGHHFGLVKNAFIRCLDLSNQTEILRYTLSEAFANETALIIGELAREGDSWSFRAIGQGQTGELLGLTQQFGIVL